MFLDWSHVARAGFSISVAVRALDVVLHLRDRAQIFCEIARTLTIGRRFLFTVDDFEHQKRYLETVTALAQRGAVSRIMYLAEFRAA